MLGDLRIMVGAHSSLAELAMRSGDVGRAAGHQLESLNIAAQTGSAIEVAYAAVVAARIAHGHDDLPVAVRLQSAADALLDEIGHVLYSTDRELCDQMMGDAAQRLASPVHEEERAMGSEMTIVDLVALARGVLETARSTGLSG